MLGPFGSMLAPSWLHVGYVAVWPCGHVAVWPQGGLKLGQVGLMLAQVGLMLAQFGLQTPKMAPKGSQYEPTWPQDGAKMASKSTILRSNFSFSRFSKICEKPKENQWFFKVRGGLTRSKIDKISIKFESILEPPASCASRGLKISSRSPQDGLLEPTWTQVGRMLAPSCLKLGPSWLHVASSWAQVGSKIDSKRIREGVQEAPRRVLGPSWGSLGAKRPSRRRQRCQNGLQMTPKSTKNR